VFLVAAGKKLGQGTAERADIFYYLCFYHDVILPTNSYKHTHTLNNTHENLGKDTATFQASLDVKSRPNILKTALTFLKVQ